MTDDYNSKHQEKEKEYLVAKSLDLAKKKDQDQKDAKGKQDTEENDETDKRHMYKNKVFEVYQPREMLKKKFIPHAFNIYRAKDEDENKGGEKD